METQVKQDNKAPIAKPQWEGIRDTRPSDYVYALMSQQVYQGKNLVVGTELDESYADWKVIEIKRGVQGYFGAIYFNKEAKHYVVAHRGTDSAAAWFEDFQGIILGQLSSQKAAAYELVQTACSMAKRDEAGLSFTGHSLGAFLAELSVFYCHKSFEFPVVNAVTFESPGSLSCLKERPMQPSILDERIDLKQLDVISYLSYPNIINTFDERIGTLYQLCPAIGNYGYLPGWFTKQAHSMDNILLEFKEPSYLPKALYLQNWPIGNQRAVYNKDAKFKDQHYFHGLVTNEVEGKKHFKLDYEAGYRIDRSLSKSNILPLKHFGPKMQEFLLLFHQWKQDNHENLAAVLKNTVKNAHIESYLLDYTLVQKNNVRLICLEKEEQNIASFRAEVSEWLNKAANRNAIIALMQKSQKSPLNIIATAVAKGAKAGSLENVQAIATEIVIVENTAPENIESMKDILEHLAKIGGTHKAELVAEGGEVTGSIKNSSVVGVKVSQQQRVNPTTSSNSSSVPVTPMYKEKQQQSIQKENTSESEQKSKQTHGINCCFL